MKRLITLLILIVMVRVGNAQNKYLVDQYGNPMHYSLISRWSNCNVLMLVDGGTKKIIPFAHIGNVPLGNLSLLSGAKQIELETRIHKDSINLYRYSIIENDTVVLKDEVIPDKVKFKWNDRSDLPGYLTMDLGTYNVVNKKLEVRIYKLPQKTKVSSAIIYNKLVKPADVLFTSVYYSRKNINGWLRKPFNSGDKIINDENTKSIGLSIKNTDLNSIYGVTLENTHGNGMNLLSPDWSNLDQDGNPLIHIDSKHFKSPGKYVITIYTKSGILSDFRQQARTITFIVSQTEKKFFSRKQVIVYALILFAVLGVLFGATVAYIKKKEARKLDQQLKEKETAQLQLKSVRAQLNPHFLFNALAGIQNLMNKNEIDNANRYLSKFARLTRNVLDSKELISLIEEKTLLDDYLQMEQLRFGFQYSIIASADLDTENIEIPAMLLQPFVENAVKHGIAEQGNKGNVIVRFMKKSSNLILSIGDNGKGFDTSRTYNGLGLNLSKNRISLLNTIYKDTPFLLDIQSDTSGTIITITLTQWL